MNDVYLYDGSFYNLLLLIITLIPLKLKNIIIKDTNNYERNLIDNPLSINISNELEKMNYLNKNVSKYLLNIMYYVYLSNEENKELIIYYFLLNSLIYKNGIINHRYLNCVNKALKISKYVSNEAHKLKGFTRFKKMKSGFYYAEVNPTNNVLLIIANHFKKRLSNEYFLIKDINRDIYAMYDKHKVIIINKEDIKYLNLELEYDEIEIEDLWKQFFKTVSIKERENKRNQMNFMPKKYWNYMIEMEDNI